MSRDMLANIAKETVDISEKGRYSLSGKTVNFKNEVEYTNKNTIIYKPNDLIDFDTSGLENFNTNIKVLNCSTLKAAYELLDKGFNDVAVLNFASAKNPGGGFLKGSTAQEESLARSSSLYLSLLRKKEFYDYHIANRTALYSDHIIFSPDVVFFRDDRYDLLNDFKKLSVITSPAVNYGAIIKNREKISKKEVDNVMIKRIEKILLAALKNNKKNIVLGSFGCGVFKNNPSDVARYFDLAINKNELFKNKFENIIFAVLDKTEQKQNFRAFSIKFKN